MAKRIPLNQRILFRGDAWVITVPVFKADGTAENVSGWTSQLTLRAKATDPDPPVVTASGVVGLGTDGLLTFTVPASTTLTVPAGDYATSAKRTNAGSEDTLVEGVVTVRLDVKNAA